VTDHYYLDSSALVKRYVAEVGTDWMSCLYTVEAGNTLYTARVSGAEIAAALFRKAREGALAVPDVQAAITKFKADFRRRYQIVEITDRLVDMAMALVERHALRGYDAVQLAAALELQGTRAALSLSPIHFVCADDRLNQAADKEGLATENPNQH
jgi:predicted nucleic acid-binding protein